MIQLLFIPRALKVSYFYHEVTSGLIDSQNWLRYDEPEVKRERTFHWDIAFVFLFRREVLNYTLLFLLTHNARTRIISFTCSILSSRYKSQVLVLLRASTRLINVHFPLSKKNPSREDVRLRHDIMSVDPNATDSPASSCIPSSFPLLPLLPDLFTAPASFQYFHRVRNVLRQPI